MVIKNIVGWLCKMFKRAEWNRHFWKYIPLTGWQQLWSHMTREVSYELKGDIALAFS